MTKGNKFSFLVTQREDTPAESKVESTTPPEVDVPMFSSPKAQTRSRKAPPTPTKASEVSEPVTAEPIKKMGRPRGKRSDPDYEQVTAYIRRDTHQAIKIHLLQEGGGREFSELIQDLLAEYLSTQKSKNLSF